MKTLNNKNIILAVSGSIAAYKAPDIVRRLQDFGAQVRVILTAGGAKFITELCLQSISKNQVHHNLWTQKAELSMRHIELGKWADAILIAPASANVIANICLGKASDLLSNVVLASDAPLLLAPAMNQQMYKSPVVKHNLSILVNRGAVLIEPETGIQACGDTGVGRLAEAINIAKQVANQFTSTKLTGKKVLITIGATVEAIDPVRFISNHSSGEMGIALAQTCIEAGASVTCIYANLSVELNEKCTNIAAKSAEQMHQAVMENISHQDVFIACAAVSDYAVKNVAKNKIKKSDAPMTIELIPNKDILADVCRLKQRPICIGFAAETENFVENGQKKLKNKRCDAIILNDVSAPNFELNSNANGVVFLSAKTEQKIAENSKQKIARKIIEICIKKLL